MSCWQDEVPTVLDNGSWIDVVSIIKPSILWLVSGTLVAISFIDEVPDDVLGVVLVIKKTKLAQNKKNK